MSSSKATPPLPEAFNDVLAKMMQAEMTANGLPLATPCNAPVEVVSHVHMTAPIRSAPESEETIPITKNDFDQTLTKHLDQLRDEIQAAHAKSVTLSEATKAKWSETRAVLEAKQKAARAKFGEVTESTGDAWEHLRDSAKHAWKDLESAVKQAVKEF